MTIAIAAAGNRQEEHDVICSDIYICCIGVVPFFILFSCFSIYVQQSVKSLTYPILRTGDTGGNFLFVVAVKIFMRCLGDG